MNGGTVILGLGVVFWCASLAWLIGSIVCACAQPWYRRKDSPFSLAREPISVVVPTSARDTPQAARDRHATLEALLRMDYPSYEILLCVDRIDEGRELLSTLRYSWLDRGVNVLGVSDPVSANAKIDAMALGLAAATHDLVLFCDDDVLVDASHLSFLVNQLQANVGLVSAAAIGSQPLNLPAYLELAFMNGQFARLHLAGDVIGYSGALGKTMLVRKQELHVVGGLRPVGVDCCEDAALTRAFSQGKMKVALSPVPVTQPVLDQRWLDVLRRHTRWMGCRRRYLPVVFICEALFSTPVTALAAAFVAHCGSIDPRYAVGATMALWCMAEHVLFYVNRWAIGPWSPIAWLIREVLILPMWSVALFAKLVTWHGRRVPLVGRR